jgi:hypothetical protein
MLGIYWSQQKQKQKNNNKKQHKKTKKKPKKQRRDKKMKIDHNLFNLQKVSLYKWMQTRQNAVVHDSD